MIEADNGPLTIVLGLPDEGQLAVQTHRRTVAINLSGAGRAGED
jgi:hypothetical protein